MPADALAPPVAPSEAARANTAQRVTRQHPEARRTARAYPEFIPEYLCFDNAAQGRSLLRRLLDDDAFWRQASCDCQDRAVSYSPASIAQCWLDLIAQAERLASDGQRRGLHTTDDAASAEWHGASALQ